MKPVKYIVEPDLYLENRDPEDQFPDKPSWAIVRHGSCLNKDFEWEYQLMPSSMDDAFLARCRFTFEEAKALATRFALARKEGIV